MVAETNIHDAFFSNTRNEKLGWRRVNINEWQLMFIKVDQTKSCVTIIYAIRYNAITFHISHIYIVVFVVALFSFVNLFFHPRHYVLFSHFFLFRFYFGNTICQVNWVVCLMNISFVVGMNICLSFLHHKSKACPQIRQFLGPKEPPQSI